MKFEKPVYFFTKFYESSQFAFVDSWFRFLMSRIHNFKSEMPSQIQLTKNRNLKVFINEPGDEFWIVKSIFPTHTDIVNIEGL